MADPDALRFRHDELRRALDIQRETVEILQGRANVILVATLGASAFIGVDVAPRAGTLGVAFGVIAIIATTILFTVVLHPRRWAWFNEPAELADAKLNHPGITLEAMLVASIDSFGRCAAHNRAKLSRLAHLIRCQAILGAGTVALWLVLAIPTTNPNTHQEIPMIDPEPTEEPSSAPPPAADTDPPAVLLNPGYLEHGADPDDWETRKR